MSGDTANLPEVDGVDGADGVDDCGSGEVVIRLSVSQAEALVRKFASGPTHHVAGEARSESAKNDDSVDADVSEAVAVFDAALVTLADTRLEEAAEREAQHVALAVITTKTSAEVAAQVTLDAAAHASNRNAETTTRIGRELSDSADQAAAEVKAQAEVLADQVTAAAATAAQVVLDTIQPGDEAEAALIALPLAAKVHAAAVATLKDTALAAAKVSVAVAAAETRATVEAAVVARTLEREAIEAARAVDTVTAATARALAVSAAARAAEVALAARSSRQSR